MTDYDTYRYADLADAIRDGADARDIIRVLGVVAVPPSEPPLTYYVEPSGTLIIASSHDSSVHMTGGVLRIIYDQRLALTPYGSNVRGGTVELVDFPDDDAAAVARVGLPYGWEIIREGAGASETKSPEHYTWVGWEIASRTGVTSVVDLQSWDVLDAIAPDDPHVWNALKYLVRLGRKGDSSRRIVDLRKAMTYLERAIGAEERRDAE